ncbi:MAG: tetraacyldisaccharide 4'-kinase [Prevotellaceae bacterium]|jgi:tetraacyldisaccharide 4'-kinase|nr:tetraacyldisaccharide 4'-kinase [Prevotellaceae bacterium]
MLLILLKLPLAGLFWLAVTLRHALYAHKILKQHEFKIPVICVGNLTVGGTGKTPHVQMLMQLLGKEGVKAAVLSRGYKRKSSGFFYVEKSSTACGVGDEPLQIKRRFPEATVAVCKDRVLGIKKIIGDNPEVKVVILDDAFQHRRVKAGLSIVLTTCDNLATKDYMLPLGRLRDSVSRLAYAEMLVVTKCPHSLKPIDFNVLEKNLKVKPYQHLYFTAYAYGSMVHLATGKPVATLDGKSVVALAGIANPQPFFDLLSERYTVAQTFRFPDHHHFGARDLSLLEQTMRRRPDSVLVVTEKDAMRLADADVSDELRSKIYYQPIDVQFLNNGQKCFIQKTLSYVRENKRIGHLY